ncbi:MAG: PKD domain-containing protein, partial [Acidobacteriota bacterium]
MKVICVARRPMEATYPHDVISGEEALLAGVASSTTFGGAPLTEYQWEFGDGTRSDRKPVDDHADGVALEARHIYTGPLGRVFRATLTVWDDTGASGADDYYVRIRPDTLRTRAHIACDLALWNLHKRMKRNDNPV